MASSPSYAEGTGAIGLQLTWSPLGHFDLQEDREERSHWQLCVQRRRSQGCHDEASRSKCELEVSHIVYTVGVDADL